jgi:hypothetical protein
VTMSLVTESIVTDTEVLAAHRSTLTRCSPLPPRAALTHVAAQYLAQGWTVAAPVSLSPTRPTLALRQWAGDSLVARVTITAYTIH